MTNSSADPEQRMYDWVELTNNQDVSQLQTVVSESFVWETPGAPNTVQGIEAATEVVQMVTGAFPDFEIELRDALVVDDKGMAEVRFTGTHENEFAGIPPTGEEFELDGMSSWRVSDGKIQELRDYLNMQEFLQQIGVAED